MSVIICVAMRRILENTRNNEKKSFSQGISVYNIEKKTLGQQKECQRPAAMQLVAPQAIRSLHEQLNQNHEKNTKNNSEIGVIDDVLVARLRCLKIRGNE